MTIKGTKIRLVYFLINNRYFKRLLSKLTFDNDKTKIFCIGLPRSGTHSIAELLKENYRLEGEHEPLASVMTRFVVKDYNELRKKKYIKNRDKLIHYDFESSYYLIHFVKQLITLYPNSLFILTVRNPIDWIISNTNSCRKNINSNNHWKRLFDFMYGSPQKNEDSPKLGDKIYNFDNQLVYYKSHIEKAIREIPKERLLIIDTYKIEDSIDEISNFLNLDISVPISKKVHAAKNRNKIKFKTDKHLKEKCLKVCHSLKKYNISLFDEYISKIHNLE